MDPETPGFASLLLATVQLRPYVFSFLAAFLVVACRDLGLRGALAFFGWGVGVAFVAEYASTRVGVPFGLYHYTATTMGAELYLSNVPLFDPVSFPFLAYAAFCLGRWVLGEDRPAGIVVLSGVMMMLLDVVIDPLAVRGDRWFLGRVFYYPEPGAYFGVPLSNFAGWMIVGWGIVGGYVWSMGRGGRGAPGRGRAPALGKAVGPGVALYYAVLLFNVAITISIGEWWLLSAGILVHGAGFLILYGLSAASTSRRRRAEPERDPAASRAGSTSH